MNTLMKLVVAPFTGAWIEIRPLSMNTLMKLVVAPFTGAWIEIVFHPFLPRMNQ